MSKKLCTFGNYVEVSENIRNYHCVDAFSYGSQLGWFSISYADEDEPETVIKFVVYKHVAKYSKTSMRHLNRFIQNMTVRFKVNFELIDAEHLEYYVTLMA